MDLMSFLMVVKKKGRYLYERVFGATCPYKLKLLDDTLRRYRIESFADLGGVWGVDGAYSRHILGRAPIRKAYIVDDHFTGRTKRRIAGFKQVELVHGDFRLAETFASLDSVDLILLFDVLLHQVNWKEVLGFSREKAAMLAIFNPQYQSDQTVRLLDLGEEAYFRLVPHTKKDPVYENLFTPKEDRDSPAVWQWGITDDDLIDTLRGLGYELVYSLDGEYWPNKAFRNKGFLFRKA